MSLKAGHFTVPGAGSFSVSGVGFEPQAVLFLWTNQATEDVWVQNTSSAVGGGMGIASVANSATPDLSIVQASIAEIWEGNEMGSEFSDHVVCMPKTRSPRTYDFRISLTSFDSDGFTMSVTDAPAGTRHVYWLAFGEFDDMASFMFSVGGVTNFPLGFRPEAFLVVGSGGTTDFPRTYLTSTWLKAGIGGMRPLYSSMGLGRGLFRSFVGDLDPRQWNIENSLGGAPDVFSLLLLHVEPYVFGSNAANWLQIRRGADLTSLDFYEGFSGGKQLCAAMGGCQVDGNTIDVVSAVGIAQTVSMAINDIPDCIFLFGPQYGLNDDTNAGQSFGFRTADFECCVAWGGRDGGGASVFTSRSRSWVSGFQPFDGSAPITDGQCDIGSTPGEFTLTPGVSDNTDKTVWWEAFFPIRTRPTIVSASPNSYAHKRIGLTSFRA